MSNGIYSVCINNNTHDTFREMHNNNNNDKKHLWLPSFYQSITPIYLCISNIQCTFVLGILYNINIFMCVYRYLNKPTNANSKMFFFFFCY